MTVWAVEPEVASVRASLAQVRESLVSETLVAELERVASVAADVRRIREATAAAAVASSKAAQARPIDVDALAAARTRFAALNGAETLLDDDEFDRSALDPAIDVARHEVAVHRDLALVVPTYVADRARYLRLPDARRTDIEPPVRTDLDVRVAKVYADLADRGRTTADEFRAILDERATAEPLSWLVRIGVCIARMDALAAITAPYNDMCRDANTARESGSEAWRPPFSATHVPGAPEPATDHPLFPRLPIF